MPVRFLQFNPLELYIALQYGDPKMMRLIPLAFAERHGLFPEAVSAIRQHIAELYKLEQEWLIQMLANKYDNDRRQDVDGVQKEQRSLVENARTEITKWELDFSHISTMEFIKQYIFLHEYPKVGSPGTAVMGRTVS